MFHGLHENYLELTVQGQERRYLLHHLLEFDPVRKCMSVITEDESGTFKYMSIITKDESGMFKCISVITEDESGMFKCMSVITG